MAKRTVREILRIDPGHGPVRLAAVDPAASPGTSKKSALRALDKDLVRLFELQYRLFAEGRRSVLLVLQGLDTSGKDGTITHVARGLNPQGTRIQSFKKPTPEELRHHFLWRVRRALPGAGEVGIFNRSHYEDVLAVRVHRLAPKSGWSSRFAEINAFEAKLAGSGTPLVKVFLHISQEEQRQRLLDRIDDPTKQWKFNRQDLVERARWADYERAYRDALSKCSTDEAPWFWVPSNRKWYRNWAVTRLLIETLEEMDPRFPAPPEDLAEIRALLEAEAPGASNGST
jgi:PPK2 family polyphosphate:nucleotide phosphotransferase